MEITSALFFNPKKVTEMPNSNRVGKCNPTMAFGGQTTRNAWRITLVTARRAMQETRNSSFVQNMCPFLDERLNFVRYPHGSIT